ncbi:hypothetical protein [Nakamurella flavida]
MHPVGPLSPTVYWLRRILAIGAAVVVLIGVVWFLAARSSRSSGEDPSTATAAAVGSAAPTFTGVLASTSTPPPTSTPPATPTTDPAAASTTPSSEVPTSPAAPTTAAPSTPEAAPASTEPAPPPAESPAPAETPAPVETPAPAPAETPAAPPAGEGSIGPAPAEPAPAPAPEPAPSYDAQGRLICADSAIAVTAGTDQAQLATGQQANLSMVITNTGTQACQRDVSGTLQVFTVLGADGSRQWSTADCFPGEGTEVRTLEPGQQVRYTVKWSGTTSAPGCVGDRVPLAPGAYTVVAALGGLSSGPAGFIVG